MRTANVTGMSTAIALIGPMPGSMLTMVPMNTPPNASPKLSGASATRKPSIRWAKASTLAPQTPPQRARRQRDAERPAEQREQKRAGHNAYQDALPPLPPEQARHRRSRERGRGEEAERQEQPRVEEQ